METLRFDINEKMGKFKILNATNGGPWHRRYLYDQVASNFEAYKAAKIPYSRTHDSGVCSIYGGPYSYDISAVFPNFNADVNDPASYDFACTDEAVLTTLDAGTETFFRLGQTIEHQITKHHTVPPTDFKKWAEICEHIIRHYNEGWADGLRLNIKYWEIWNEPDLDTDKNISENRTWGGTPEEFFDMYEITAKHLKKCFPNLKIGGPALAGSEEWRDAFLKTMHERNVPIDFFSWHIYCREPKDMMNLAARVRKCMNDNGYENAESILNEWNYVKGWTEDFIYSIKNIGGMKGAAFVMACISEAQTCEGIDMLMYYDTRPSKFCGPFDYYTCKVRKPYYPLKWYSMFYDMDAEIRRKNNIENIYTLCGTDKNDKLLCVLTHYSDDDFTAKKQVCIDFGKDSKYEIYLLDENHDGEKIGETSDLNFDMNLHSCILIKEI